MPKTAAAWISLFLCLSGAILLTMQSRHLAAAGDVLVLDVQGAIGPATSDYVERGLALAREQGAELVVLRMDTPGGLDTSMRSIVRAILSSSVPVASFVAPSGARAASAGTYILYASHVAAMAPGTNLGAATPVNMGGIPKPGSPEPLSPLSKPQPDEPGQGQQDGADETADKETKPAQPGTAMERKLVNDAVAYIKSLAQMRGRNVEWAERAVREGVSLPASEALQQGVIDLLADDLSGLLKVLDGHVVTVQGVDRTLSTRSAGVTIQQPDWRNRLLSVITNPNVAYILMLIGMYGLFFEFANPGFVVPGVVGAICLLLALYALQVLPVNYAGLGLILLGIVFMLAEAFAPSFGALGIGGVIAFVVGSVILFDDQSGAYAVSIPLIAGFAASSALFFFGVVGMAVKARGRPIVSGAEQLLHSEGVAVADFEGRGHIHVHGETWSAQSATPIQAGQRVRIDAIKGLVLQVTPATKE